MKLIFLENDFTDEPEDLILAKEILEDSEFFSPSELENVAVISAFEHRNSEEVIEILFNKENIIITYSMYVGSSSSQLYYFLSSAGNRRVKNCTFIDCSGRLLEVLHNNSYGFHNLQVDLLHAIETNNILTYDRESGKIKRIRVHFKGKEESIFYLELVGSYSSLKEAQYSIQN